MSSSYAVLSYTRRATRREEANNADIAYSMHLALRSPVNGEWISLNENYGIFFAAAIPHQSVPQSALAACTATSHIRSDIRSSSCDAPHDVACDNTHDTMHNTPHEMSDAVAYNSVMPGVDLTLKSLRDPYLFRLRDGRFGVVATQIQRDGTPDGSEQNACILAVSDNLTSYTRLGMIHIAITDDTRGMHKPSVVFDSTRNQYVVRWLDHHSAPWQAYVDDILAAPTLTTPLQGEHSVVQYHQLEGDFGIPDAVPGNILAISEDEAQRLIARFGRVYNTEAHVPAYMLASTTHGDDTERVCAALRSQRAILQYSDGSRATRAVDWDSAQLDALCSDIQTGRLSRGDCRIIHGHIRCTAYPVPFAVERADPSVFAWNWNGKPLFLFIATEDADGNCIDPLDGHTHMPLRVAESIEALSDRAGGRECEIDLLRCGDCNTEGRVMTGCFWAPELHVIGGRLSILFMPCFDGDPVLADGTPNERAGKPDMWTGCCHIMQLLQDSEGNDLDPRDPAHWSTPAPIVRASGDVLNPVQHISLDMTVIEDSGRWYYAWQQIGSVWIASFDPQCPTRLTSEPTQIIVPEFAWDNVIAEGPNAIVHDDRIFLIYSGSLVGIDYTTGLVTAPAGQHVDLCDPSVWQKLDYPLQKSGIYNHEWQLGTGHGMWSSDEDGNTIYVFHNAEYRNGRYSGRDAQVRRVHWSAEGMPILDMQATEELNPSYSDITMEIIVQ